jgi:hypothetical protein
MGTGRRLRSGSRHGVGDQAPAAGAILRGQHHGIRQSLGRHERRLDLP